MVGLGRVQDFELLKFLGKGSFGAPHHHPQPNPTTHHPPPTTRHTTPTPHPHLSGAVYQARRAADKKTYAIKKV